MAIAGVIVSLVVLDGFWVEIDSGCFLDVWRALETFGIFGLMLLVAGVLVANGCWFECWYDRS